MVHYMIYALFSSPRVGFSICIPNSLFCTWVTADVFRLDRFLGEKNVREEDVSSAFTVKFLESWISGEVETVVCNA